MKNDIANQLHDLLSYINNQAVPHELLLDVVERVEEMIQCVAEPKINLERLKKLALGLGMYISYDFEFSESETGTKILYVINSILRDEFNQENA